MRHERRGVCPTPTKRNQSLVWPGQLLFHASHHRHTFLERGLRFTALFCGSPWNRAATHASTDTYYSKSYVTEPTRRLEAPGCTGPMGGARARCAARPFGCSERMNRVHLGSDRNLPFSSHLPPESPPPTHWKAERQRLALPLLLDTIISSRNPNWNRWERTPRNPPNRFLPWVCMDLWNIFIGI